MNIYQKLVEVRKKVPYLQKESQGHQYKYVGSSDVLGAIRSELDAQGLLLLVAIKDHKVTTSGEDGKTLTYFTELDLLYTWVNAENPEEKIEIPFYAQGIDRAGEKGVGKSLTYGEKYFLLKFFNIATDNVDPDAFQEKQQDRKPQEKPSGDLLKEIKDTWKAKFSDFDINKKTQKTYKKNVDNLSKEQAEEFLSTLKAIKE
ncbi:ERF family protein [Cytobacillus sp. IB215665]|uniref:ERF family protein n=1 Tax=Cytobacillus sp. IB215665 TaxID=3097357 RepID=UPI002A0C13D7|nr:ERF family protein [Cytobacillus sp. IB215665]MDX8367838.1 ERF family protein [Cytobacillus sp. IB215665]